MKLLADGRRARVGLAGSGYISAGLLRVLSRFDDIEVTAVLTARDAARDGEYPRPQLLVRDIARLVEGCDLVVECSGHVTRAMLVVEAAFAVGLPVVTVNAEFHVTAGHLFTARGLLTESEGDQPGALAALTEEIALMGFQPLVYGNVKTFLDPNPSVENMRRQAALHGISQQQVTSFTDGTKLHIELTLVANGLDATIAPSDADSVRGATLDDCCAELARTAQELGRPISGYCMPHHTDAHIFITATHPEPVAKELAHYKLGPGPLYTFTRNRHLGHFEVPRTIRRVLETGQPLINNATAPAVTVAAVAKTTVPAGTRIRSAVGSRTFRGIAVRAAEHPKLIPIGLLEGATVIRTITEGALLSQDDIVLSDALTALLAAHAAGGAGR